MDIKLAGYNIETDLMESISENLKSRLTPEIFSSAYARISRSKKSITELRGDAREDVKKARSSNKKIIFEMGHHSVAEHAVFNFDIIGLSRLALESIERFRLVSYTEKSQRYVTLDGDYYLPVEFRNSIYKEKFIEIIELQNNLYKSLYKNLKEYIFDKFADLALKKSNTSLLDGWAKEDARYILSLSTLGQVGMTINARNLEHLFRNFSLSDIDEVKKAGEKIYDLVEKIAPSIILFPEPSKFEKYIASGFQLNFKVNKKPIRSTEPEIIDFDKNGDNKILASFFSIVNSIDFNSAIDIANKMTEKEKIRIFKDMFGRMEFFDSPPRSFELPDITFQAIVSASNFAQLKRHRIATLLSGEYRPELGNTIPENIKKINMEKEFEKVILSTNSLYFELKEKYGRTADYILTNSHKRMVIMKMNLREIFHFARLRSDNHAQWDIKDLSDKLLSKVREIFPVSTMLLCGKDQFVSKFEGIYNKKPDFTI